MQRPLLILISCLIWWLPSHAQYFTGGITLGGSDSDRLLDLAATSDAYFAVGSYQGTWSGRTAQGGSDAYLMALDTLLQPSWIRTWGSRSDDECTHLAATTQALYTATFFWDSITIDTTTLRAQGSALAILRWSHTGSLQWARLLTGNGIKHITGLSANAHTVRAIGYFSDSLSANGAVHAASGINDAFAITLDSSGQVLGWQQWGNTGQTRAWAIAPSAESSNQWYMAIGFNDTATFGDSLLQSGARDWDAVLLAHDSTGQLQWLQELAGVGDVRIAALAYQSGRVWMTGHYINSLSIADQFYVTALNDFDVFVHGFEAHDGRWVRGTTWGGTDDELALALHVQPNSLVIGGYYFGDAVFSSTTLYGDPFIPLGHVLAVDTLLQLQTAVTVGDMGAELVVGAFAERPHTDVLALGGVYASSLSMTPNIPLISNGSNDGYILLYPQGLLTEVVAPTPPTAVTIAPNPVHNQLHWQSTHPLTALAIFDLSGRCVRQWLSPTSAVHVADLPAGAYVLRWRDVTQATGTIRWIKAGK